MAIRLGPFTGGLDFLIDYIDQTGGHLINRPKNVPLTMEELLDAVYDEIYERLVKPALKELADAIEELRVQIRIWKHDLKKALADWLGNDVVFFLTVVGSVLLIVFAPQIATWFKGTTLFTFGKNLIGKIGDGVAKLIDVEKLIDLHAVHTIVKLVWDDYAELTSDIANAAAALSSEIGEGSAWIAAMTNSTRSLVHGYHATLGLPAETAELAWYDDAAEFTAKVDERFHRYARDPGRIYQDFMTEYLIPHAEKTRELETEQVEQMRENYNRGIEMETGIKQMQTAIDDMITLMPNLIEEQFRKRWDPFNEWLTETLAVIDNHLFVVLDGVLTALETRIEEQEAVNQSVMRKVNNPDLFMTQYYLLPNEAQKRLAETFDDILTPAEVRQRGEITRILADATPLFSQIQISADLASRPALALEAPSSEWGMRKVRVNIPSPFVGDY